MQRGIVVNIELKGTFTEDSQYTMNKMNTFTPSNAEPLGSNPKFDQKQQIWRRKIVIFLSRSFCVLCCDSKSVTSEVIIIVSPIKSSLECVTQFSLCSGESFAKFFCCCCRTNLLLQLLAHCHCRGCLDMCPFGSTICVGINFERALLFSGTYVFTRFLRNIQTQI